MYQDHLSESRTAVAVLTHLLNNDPLSAARLVDEIETDALAYIAALQALGVQFLTVIDQLAALADMPGANARALLGQLREQMALEDTLE